MNDIFGDDEALILLVGSARNPAEFAFEVSSHIPVPFEAGNAMWMDYRATILARLPAAQRSSLTSRRRFCLALRLAS